MIERFPTRAAIRRPERRPEVLGRTEKPVRKVNILGPLWRVVKMLFYLAVLAAAIYVIFFSSILTIKNVEISGVKSVEISDYLNQSLLGKNIVLFLPGKYLDGLTSKFPVVQEAKMVRGLPSTIKVDIAERQQKLVWCSDKCFEIDNNGLAYQEISKPSDSIIIVDQSNLKINPGDRVVSEDFINFYLKALGEISGLGLKIKEVDVKDTTFNLAFKTDEGWQIIFDTSASLDNQISALKQILDKNRADIKEYADLRVEGVGYLK